MAAAFEVDGNNLMIKFEYAGPLAKTQEVAVAAAHYLWEHGYGDHGTDEEPILFDDLSNNEKLVLIDKHVKRVIMDAAHTYHVNARQSAERKAAQLYAEENIIIE